MLELILILFLIGLYVGTLPNWPYSRAWGVYPCRGVGLVLVIVLILSLMRLL